MKEPAQAKKCHVNLVYGTILYRNVKITKFTHFVVVSFSEVSLLFSCLIFVTPLGAPGARGPRFIEPPQPPVSVPVPGNKTGLLCELKLVGFYNELGF